MPPLPELGGRASNVAAKAETTNPLNEAQTAAWRTTRCQLPQRDSSNFELIAVARMLLWNEAAGFLAGAALAVPVIGHR